MKAFMFFILFLVALGSILGGTMAAAYYATLGQIDVAGSLFFLGMLTGGAAFATIILNE
jgi:hypothetical protein